MTRNLDSRLRGNDEGSAGMTKVRMTKGYRKKNYNLDSRPCLPADKVRGNDEGSAGMTKGVRE